MKHAIVSSIVLGIVATSGDWFWATFVSRHRMISGLIHGAAFCLAMGAMIGLPQRKAVTGAIAGIAIGVASALLFYLLAPVLRYSAMFPAWFALWVLLALLYHRLAPGTPISLAIVRGILAGLASGLAFYLVSGMWTQWSPRTINYLDHFVRWTFAFAPGFIALQGGRRQARAVSDII